MIKRRKSLWLWRKSTHFSAIEAPRNIGADVYKRQELEDGALVNLGIGIPQLVPDYVPKNVRLILQTENGVINAGPHFPQFHLSVLPLNSE